MSESTKPWVPGFIWVTKDRFAHEPEDQFLIAVSDITKVEELEVRGNAQIHGSKPGAIWEILETPDQVAALIREEWRQRVMNEAIVRAEYGSGQYPVEGNVDEREA